MDSVRFVPVPSDMKDTLHLLEMLEKMAESITRFVKGMEEAASAAEEAMKVAEKVDRQCGASVLRMAAANVLAHLRAGRDEMMAVRDEIEDRLRGKNREELSEAVPVATHIGQAKGALQGLFQHQNAASFHVTMIEKTSLFEDDPTMRNAIDYRIRDLGGAVRQMYELVEEIRKVIYTKVTGIDLTGEEDRG